MKRSAILFVAVSGILQIGTSVARADEMCKPLREFVESIKPDEKRSFEFQTSWGANFKDSPERVIYAKRCVDHDYAPAKAVCRYLMEHGAVEFSNNNVQRAISCLSSKTTFDTHLSLSKIEASFPYGTQSRGSAIEVLFGWDESIGAMVFKLDADGY
jgi:hypothetical protein